jgi:hypothetical protein
MNNGAVVLDKSQSECMFFKIAFLYVWKIISEA